MKKFLYYRKNVWGNEVIYIAAHASNEMAIFAKNIEKLTRRKTLLPQDMDALEGLGFSFEEVIAP